MSRVFKLTPDAFRCRSRHSVRGQNAQRAGSNFQKVISWSAGAQKDIVALEELPPFGARRVGGGKTVFLPICSDYVGALVGSTGLFFDAKSCGQDAVSLNVKTMILSKPHQLRFLQKMGRAGQCAGYLIEAKERGLYLWLDVKHILDALPIRFARDGVLCRQFLALGSTSGMVDFKVLRECSERNQP